MKGVPSSGDRQLLAPMSQEELEGITSSYLLKEVFVCEELFSHRQGTPLIP
ncbi:UNVERIFIED_CONTAM: hypothetical protein Slati_1463100 [Sesamum latifolium]|uniref:Uncharacterized protein n=1 Tax=Sesamum latifolium TaxID=2727402 RepID=A0AAW2X4E7_9LAMI